MAKKKSQRKSNKKLFGIIAIIVALAAAFVIGWCGIQAYTAYHNNQRLSRINEIFNSIKVEGRVFLTTDNIFGDKRVYEWDKSRSHSSSKEFTVGRNVDKTFAQLDAAIKAAGFKFIDEPYPGSVSIQHHYKSDKGEYIRLTVTSKPKMQKAQNDLHMHGELSKEYFAMDKNAGPSVVVLKVNLDDNNE